MRSLLLASVLLLAGCGDPGPEGYTLAIRFVSMDPEVIDRLRLTFTAATGQRFAAQEEMAYEGDQIRVRVESDGVLVMEIDGEHVRSHYTLPDGEQALYELEIYSEDPTMNTGPVILGSATRDAMFIGQGSARLPEWPPVLGGVTQLAIQCGTEAAAAGLCF
jgi:hypothetical protein